MNQKVWCFLVSANKYLDYRTVVAPGFMCAQNYTLILAQAAGGEITDKGTAYYRRIINSKEGALTLVFRVIKAVKTDIGISEDGVVKDSFGRVIRLIEGVVLQGKVSETDIVITSEDFDKIHEEIIENYQKFWSQTNAIPAYASTLLPLSEKENKDNAFQLINLDDYIVGGKPKKELKLETNQQLPKQEQYKDQSLGDRSQSRQPQNIRKFDDRESGEEDVTQFFTDCFSNISKFLPNPIEIAIEVAKELLPYEVNVKVDTPDGKRIITGDKYGNIKVWYLDGAEIPIQPPPKHNTKITSMEVDNKKKILASGDKKGNVKIWELELGRASLTKKKTIQASQRPIQSLEFSRDGKTLTSKDDQRTTKTWNL